MHEFGVETRSSWPCPTSTAGSEARSRHEAVAPTVDSDEVPAHGGPRRVAGRRPGPDPDPDPDPEQCVAAS
jgi:hypothetical protein